jgi:hypothetical protein
MLQPVMGIEKNQADTAEPSYKVLQTGDNAQNLRPACSAAE